MFPLALGLFRLHSIGFCLKGSFTIPGGVRSERVGQLGWSTGEVVGLAQSVELRLSLRWFSKAYPGLLLLVRALSALSFVYLPRL